MKILFVQPCYENFGGYFRAIGLAKALAKKGVKVDLLCSSKLPFSFKVRRKVLAKNLIRYELPRWEINFFLNGRIARGLISCFFVGTKKYDLIHTFSTIQVESVLPFLTAKLLNKKVVFDWDDYWQDSPLFHRSGFLVKRFISFLENSVPAWSKNMTVTSDYLAKKAKTLGSNEVAVIINGVDLDQFKPIVKTRARSYLGISKDEKIILSFGNTYEGKRARLLLQTYKEILKIDSKIRLFLNQDLGTLLKAAGNRPENLGNTFVTGFINLSTKKGVCYLGAADVILFLMGESPGEKACFPVRIGTFINSGKKIALNEGKTQVVRSLRGYDNVIFGKTSKELAKKVCRYLNSDKVGEKNFSKLKRDLSWNKLAEKTLGFYNQIIENV